MKPVIVIVGPTASGKSELAQQVALRLDGEVVSADSMQIYRGMDIGTAKLPKNSRVVPHHLIDICNPGQAYSAQLFQKDARAAFNDIDARGKISILCGGTGFYVQAALEDMRFPSGEQTDNPLRQHFESYLIEYGALALWNLLDQRDKASAAIIHPNNSKRVIRALEMNEQGISYAEQSKNIKQLDEVVPSLRFCLDVDPETLAFSIDKRVDAMIKDGLIDEVKSLLDQGFTEALTAPQAIGYKEIVAALQGSCSLDEAIEQIKLATRQYAKRQRSWFRRDKKLIHYDRSLVSTEEIVENIIYRYTSRASNRARC